MTFTPEQAAEVAKYERCYVDPAYRMGSDRLCQCEALMRDPVPGATFLDVGCGRGETLALAERLGYADWWGVEAVELLLGERVVRGEAWRVPFPEDAFHTVACFDVLEHLIRGDDAACVMDLCRVASARVLLTIGLYPSTWGGGPDLHINLRTPEEWTECLTWWAQGWVVDRRADLDCKGINAAWVLRCA